MLNRNVPIDPNLPAPLRPGSANTEPEAPLCRTSDGRESIKVALAGNVAVRITINGYDVLLAHRDDPAFKYIIRSDLSTRSIATLGGVRFVVQKLQERGDITPKTAASISQQLEAWPGQCSYAWHQLHPCRTRPLPPFAPEGLDKVRSCLRGH